MTITHDYDSTMVQDPIVLAVMAKYYERSKRGVEKYGTTLMRDDLNTLDWLNHLQDELMDATLYLERLKKELKHFKQQEQ